LAWSLEVADLYERQAQSGTTSAMAGVQSLEHLRQVMAGLLGELQARARFVQTRAADMRVSGRLDEVANALLALRKEAISQELAGIISQVDGPEGQRLERMKLSFEGIQRRFPELERASSRELDRLRSQLEAELAKRPGGAGAWRPAIAFAANVAAGLASNLSYGWLKSIFPSIP
jgi:hypothetical protein